MRSTPARRCVDVAVCGAGPVGLTAAALLSARGLTVAVLEKHRSTSDEPKAISIDDESLRTFQQAGVVDAVLPIVVPGTGTRYYDRHGNPLFHARGPSPFRHGYPFKNPFAQPDLEKALLEALLSRPNVEFFFEARVVGIAQTENRVAVKAQFRGADLLVDACYVFGCDGGRSATRLLQGGTMTGRSHRDVWLVVDTIADPHTERFAMHHGDPSRPHVIVPGLDGKCRYEFRLFDGEGDPHEPPSFDLIHRLVSPFRPLQPSHVVRAVSYRFNAVVADQWMIGRSFLLGDAAHMMPPFAGQGLNSGIRDAANLAWKAADVIQGRLDAGTLDTYERERRPHALSTVKLSERLGRVVMTTSPRLAERRDALVQRAVTTAEGRSFFEQMRYRPIQHYSDGLIVGGSDRDIVGLAIGQPLAFDTASRSVRRLDDVLGNGWALFGVDVAETDWRAVESVVQAFGARPTVVSTHDDLPRTHRPVLIDVDTRLNREFNCYAGRFVLLRPDRFVAAAWPPQASPDLVPNLLEWTPASVPAHHILSK